MKLYDVNGSLTFEHNKRLYTVSSDVYTWDPDETYQAGTYVLKDPTLLRAKVKTTGAWLKNFDVIQPTDKVSYNITNDDIEDLYKTVNDIKDKLEDISSQEHGGSGTLPPSVDADVNEIKGRLTTIENTYVRTVNSKTPVDGNVDIECTVPPPPEPEPEPEPEPRPPVPVPDNTVQFKDDAIQLKPEQGITYVVDGTEHQVFSHNDGTLVLGSNTQHLDIQSLDDVTVNGHALLTVNDAVDLINDQNIFGRKHFERIYTTEAPQEDNQIPNRGWVLSVLKQEIDNATDVQQKIDTVYVNSNSQTDEEYSSLRDAVAYVRSLNLTRPMTIVIKGSYQDKTDDILELPDVGVKCTIVGTSTQTILPPIWVTGRWELKDVLLSENRVQQSPLEVDSGWCILNNVTIILNHPAAGTDAIFVHNSGTLQLAPNSTTRIRNMSETVVTRAINLKHGTMLGNMDKHNNLGEPNTLLIHSTRGGFGAAIYASNASKCVYLERTTYKYANNVPYVVKQGSVIQGVTNNNGESDASSMVVTY